MVGQTLQVLAFLIKDKSRRDILFRLFLYIIYIFIYLYEYLVR